MVFGKEHQVERTWLGDVRKLLRPKINTLLYSRSLDNVVVSIGLICINFIDL